MSQLLPETIETERLRLEAMRPDTVDVRKLYDICSNDPGIEEVTEYVTWEPHRTPKETLEFLEGVTERRNDDVGGAYLVRPRDGEDGSGEIAGVAGCGVDWDRRTVTLGFWLRKRFWGRGYSGERAAAFMTLAFDRLDLEIVAVSHEDGNDRSRRAIEKYVEARGGRYEGLLRNHGAHGGEPADCHRYTVSQEEWCESEPTTSVTFEK